jgi:hypothetical protein
MVTLRPALHEDPLIIQDLVDPGDHRAYGLDPLLQVAAAWRGPPLRLQFGELPLAVGFHGDELVPFPLLFIGKRTAHFHRTGDRVDDDLVGVRHQHRLRQAAPARLGDLLLSPLLAENRLLEEQVALAAGARCFSASSRCGGGHTEPSSCGSQ